VPDGDTSVWSLALRHRSSTQSNPIVRELEELIRDTRVCVISTIRQEILSGIKDYKQFELLKNRLRAFPDLKLNEEDFERATEIFNQCRAAGIQGSNTDFLICATAEGYDLSVFTTDQDFVGCKKYSRILLHEPLNEK
jgi:predicted nucleic acid-binding protein